LPQAHLASDKKRLLAPLHSRALCLYMTGQPSAMDEMNYANVIELLSRAAMF
jgi:hypothetical protein